MLESPTRFLLLNKISPEVILEICGGNNPKIANVEIDLPEPDSPTIPKISLEFNSKEIELMIDFSNPLL